jgi:hypothetical protein
MKHGVFGWLAITATLLAGSPARAHHAITAKFDPAQRITITGMVTKVDWLNPHVHIFLEVQSGLEFAAWAVELESQIDLGRSGWSSDTLDVGEVITVEGMSARNGTNQVWGDVVVRSGTEARLFTLTPSPALADNVEARPTPRWPNQIPRLGPEPGERGYWGNPSLISLMETGVDVAVDNDGLLADIGDVDRVAPFRQWARDLYEVRQRDSLKDDPMFLFCKPPGGPRQFQLPYGIQFVQEQYRERIWVMIGGGNHNWRFIYTDGRDQNDPTQVDFGHPLYYGRAVGEWEGDTLVVDTIDFNEDFWFSNGGLPHTEQLHLVERISRPDYNTLEYEVTIDDPGAYTRTWTASWALEWIPGEELPRYFCQDNRP